MGKVGGAVQPASYANRNENSNSGVVSLKRVSHRSILKTMTTNTQPPAFVLAATLAAELDGVVEIARTMSIAALNAKAVTARSGEATRGFGPITIFIDELARGGKQMVQAVSETALAFSRLAVSTQRAEDTARRFVEAEARGASRAALAAAHAAAHDEVEQLSRATAHRLKTLRAQLDEMELHIRATDYAAASCLIEVARAGIRQEALETVAYTLREAVSEIRTQVQNSRVLLNQCQDRETL